jgi:formylglycine-generating enzyme required for sulfatase activity
LLVLVALLSAAAEERVHTSGRRTVPLVASPPEVISIPAGPFLMGSGPEDLKSAFAMCTEEYRAYDGPVPLEPSLRCTGRFEGEGPRVQVFLPAFAIDRTEVTLAGYRECNRRGPCAPGPLLFVRSQVRDQVREPDQVRLDRHPVEAVTWWEAAVYCRWRGGRLPTEAEWEKAARGIAGRTWPWGAEWQGRRANHGRRDRSMADGPDAALDGSDGFEGTSPVGAFSAGESPYGAADLAGNVWEWTDGYFTREGPQSTTRAAPRGGLSGDEHPLRGGSYASPPSDLRAARRIGYPGTERRASIGFRCAYDLAPRD